MTDLTLKSLGINKTVGLSCSDAEMKANQIENIKW